MGKISFAVSSGLRGYMFAVMSLVFFLLAAGSADAQQYTKLLFDQTFTVRKWNAGALNNKYLVYGASFSGVGFTYENVRYEVTAVSSGGSRVNITIKPQFPPTGVRRSDFTLHTGSAEHTDKLSTFNFGDSNNNRWAGSSGWHGESRGVIRITVTDTSVADHLRFAAIRPVPENNSGRLEFVRDPDADSSDKWRICNTGFGEEEAEVACRQLGLPADGAEVLDLNNTGWLDITRSGFNAWLDVFEIIDINTTDVLLDGLECEGSEEKLVECGHLGIGVVSGGSCPIENTVGVSCGN